METALRLHLLPALGDVALGHIAEASYEYAGMRSRAGAAPATIRYELAVLRRMVGLAWRREVIPTMPHVASVSVENARAVFFEGDELRRLLAELPLWLADAVLFAAVTGWRRSEVFGLRWSDVDVERGIVRLDPERSKNAEGRVFPFGEHEQLRELMLHRLRVRHGSWVFHRRGRQVRDFRAVWIRACRRAGVEDRVFHDLRRTAARAMERAGVPRTVAMQLMGHKTEAMYRRYAIVSERDLASGVGRLGRY